MIKAIIFDFGKVLSNFDHMITCERLAKYSPFSKEEIHNLIFKSGLEKKYDEGLLTSKSFFSKAKKAIKANEKLTFEIFSEIWGNVFSENPGIEDIILQIKTGVNLFLLSNTNRIHWQYISKLPVIKNVFLSPETTILSFLVGVRKPDEKIFLEAISRTNCLPEEIIFIDDIPEYVETFRKLGGHGIVYNSQHDTVSKLLEELRRYKVI